MSYEHSPRYELVALLDRVDYVKSKRVLFIRHVRSAAGDAIELRNPREDGGPEVILRIPRFAVERLARALDEFLSAEEREGGRR